MNEVEKCLRPTPTIDSDSELVKEKAQALTEGKHEAVDRASSLFYFVRDEIKYTPFVPPALLEDYRASGTLERWRGFCVEKATLLVALARATGIPACIHLADIRNHLISDRLLAVMKTNLFSYHGYSELYIEGKWVRATPAFDLETCRANRIVPVEFDGEHDALFHPRNLDGKLHIEYVRDHGCYEDVPGQEIVAAWAQVYGDGSREGLDRFGEARKKQNRA